jgi:GGDEF domain-containing protein
LIRWDLYDLSSPGHAGGSGGILKSAVDSYRAALSAAADAGAQAYPPTGENLKQSLLKLQENLINTPTPGTFAQTEQSVGQQFESLGRQRMQEAERLASVDPPTGASNRRILERRVERHVAEASPFFVLYLDLNEFTQINDTLGHQAGDDLLKQFAGELP